MVALKKCLLRQFRLYHKGTWDSAHIHRVHGFALCYDKCKVEIIQDDFDAAWGLGDISS